MLLLLDTATDGSERHVVLAALIFSRLARPFDVKRASQLLTFFSPPLFRLRALDEDESVESFFFIFILVFVCFRFYCFPSVEAPIVRADSDGESAFSKGAAVFSLISPR